MWRQSNSNSVLCKYSGLTPLRLNGIRHILNLIPYKKVPREKVKLPKRSMKGAYDDEASLKGRKFVPQKY